MQAEMEMTVSAAQPAKKKYNDRLDEGQLITLYNKWVKNPSAHEYEMYQTAERLVNHVLRGRNVKTAYTSYTSYEDLRQELLYAFYAKILPKVKDPDNKRLYNFFWWSLYRRLCKIKISGFKKFNREETELKSGCPHTPYLADTIVEMEYFPDFGCAQVNQVAQMLAAGHAQKEIRQQMGLSAKQLAAHMETLRQYYAPKADAEYKEGFDLNTETEHNGF